MISVLCPSRNRPELLAKSLASLGSGNFELLVCVDLDEPQGDAYMEISKDRLVTVYQQPRHSYEQLHEYYNFLASKAKGDWLMLWNDDAIMETPGWADFVHQHDPTKPLVLSVWEEVNNLFPIISRKFYEILGHYSLQTHVDSWVQIIGQRTGTQVYIPGIKIRHEKPDDETGRESTEIAHRKSGPQFSEPQFRELLNQDEAKIREWMESHAGNN